mgnify:CR=1 FL=1
MVVCIFIEPRFTDNKTTYILASSKEEAITIYCEKYNESRVIAEKRLKRTIKKKREFFYEYIDW